MAFTHSGLLPAYLAGLTLSNDATSPNTVIDIAPGIAADDVNGILMPFPTAFTKTLASTWAAGSGANGLDTGSPAASTWYHLFLIQKDADGSTDILFSLSATSPTMPSGYTNKRRIGSVRTDASSNLLAFTQLGDEFLWSSAILDIANGTPSTAGALVTLTVPSGLKVWALFNSSLVSTTDQAILFTSPDEGNPSTGVDTGFYFYSIVVPSTPPVGAAQLLIRTNTSSQVNQRVSNTPSTTYNVWTRGWIDTRGRLG